MFFETIKLAIRAISRNVLRSFLTVLGVVIGVAAVIAMVTIGNGTTESVKQELSRLGTNLLFIRAGQAGPGHAGNEAKRFTMDDVEAIQMQIPGLKAVAPNNRSSAMVIASGKNYSAGIVGATNDYFIAQEWKVAEGREFTPNEDRGGQIGCIIGSTVRTELFGSLDPIGEQIRINQVSCPVVGVLAKKGDSSFGDDQDATVIMPIRIHMRRLGGTNVVQSLMVSAQDGVRTDKVKKDLEQLLRERRRIGPDKEDDFVVNDMAEISAAMTETTTLLTGLLGAVAAVSLLVGGIGIMNIMLVSVTERTREIGIRLAIGALETQVLTQFLVEAVMLSALGGLAGILIGLGLAYGAVQLLSVPFVVSMPIILFAFGFSAAIGVVFGYFPAKRAASLSPIEALRHE